MPSKTARACSRGSRSPAGSGTYGSPCPAPVRDVSSATRRSVPTCPATPRACGRPQPVGHRDARPRVGRHHPQLRRAVAALPALLYLPLVLLSLPHPANDAIAKFTLLMAAYQPVSEVPTAAVSHQRLAQRERSGPLTGLVSLRQRGWAGPAALCRAAGHSQRNTNQTWLWFSTAVTISETASSIGTPFFCAPLRYRNETARPATSSSPASSMNGIFCRCALRIFFCMRSSPESTSTRIPSVRSLSAMPSRYGTCASVIGMPTTWTGASQGGSAPA